MNPIRKLGRWFAVLVTLAVPGLLLAIGVPGLPSTSSGSAVPGLPPDAESVPGLPAGRVPGLPGGTGTAGEFRRDDAFAGAALRDGRYPTWEPGRSAALLGPGRVGAVFPLDPWRLLGDRPWLFAFRAGWLLVLAAWGTFRLLRCYGVLRAPALAGALAYAMSGVSAAWLGGPMIRGLAVVPLVFWMAERLVRRPDVRRAAPLALAVGLAGLADTPEIALGTIAAALLYLVGRTALTGRALGPPARRRHALAWSLPALVVGAAIGAPQWIPSLLDPPAFAALAVRPAHWLGLFGPAADPVPTDAPTPPIPYVGVFGLVAALVACFTRIATDARVRLWLLLVAGAAAAATFEQPGYAVAALPVVALGLGILAALGIERCYPIFEAKPPARTTLLLAFAIVLAVWIVRGVRLANAHRGQPIQSLWTDGPLAPWLAHAAIALGLAAVSLVVLRQLRHPWFDRLLRVCPLVLIALDLASYAGQPRGLYGSAGRSPAPTQTLAATTAPPRSVTATRVAPDRIDVTIGARDAATTVVVAERIHDGWTPTAGTPAPGHHHLAVVLPPGDATTITWRFDAPGRALGGWCGAVGLALALLAWCVGSGNRRRRAAKPEPRVYLWIPERATGATPSTGDEWPAGRPEPLPPTPEPAHQAARS